MTGRTIWCLVTAAAIGMAAAGGFRGLPWLLAIAVAIAVWALSHRWAGVAIASSIGAMAWATSVGPWSGSTRWWSAVAAATVIVVVAFVVAPRRVTVARVLTALLVSASALVVRPPPSTGTHARDERLSAVDSYVRGQVNDGAIVGAAVAIVEHGDVVFARGYGRAKGRRSMTPRTPVVIGSTSKSVTAVAVLHLVEQHRLDLDAPIRDYLPWLDPNDPRVETVTTRQLLVDTSGIPTWAGWTALAGDGRADRESLHHLINHVQLTSPPGRRFQYSNANYLLLGQIIEQVTGTPYADVVRTRIFEPLGMTSTRAAATSRSTANRYWFGLPVRSRLPYLEVGLPAGTITSSATDLARYLRFELSGGDAPAVLTADTLQRSQTPAVKAEGFGVAPGRQYAMGWYTASVDGEPAVFHAGDVFDSSSMLLMLPERDLGIAVVATTSDALTPVSKTLGEGVAATILRRPAPDFSRSLSVATAIAIAVAGITLAFAAVRLRTLLARDMLATTRAAATRIAILDILIPATVLLGLPAAFGRYLDRAEPVNAVQLWTLVIRGAPDIGILLVTALVGRALIGGVVAARTINSMARADNRLGSKRSRGHRLR
jgi:CubicO group peptidase (beta-lactamase class C family)